MDYGKLTTYIGFAIKTGSAVLGLDGIKKAEGIKVIIYSAEASGNTIKEIRYYAAKKKAVLLRIEDADLSEITKKNNCKAVAVTDYSLAQGIITNYKAIAEDIAE